MNGNDKNNDKDLEKHFHDLDNVLFNSSSDKYKSTSKPEYKDSNAQYSDLINNKTVKKVVKDNTVSEMPKNTKHKRDKKIFTSILLAILIICVSVILAISCIAFFSDLLGIGKSNTGDGVQVVIEEGDSTSEIVDKLADKGVVNYPFFFKLYLKVIKSDENFATGEHIIKTDLPYEHIVKNLKTKPYSTNETINITFAEGITLQQIATMLDANGVCDVEDFLNEFNTVYSNSKYTFAKSVPDGELKFYKMEGYFYPDTYTFYINSDPLAIVDTVRQNFNKKVYSKFNTEITESDYTLDEIITLASMVQAEADNYEDMQKVASVFLNRLNDSSTYPQLQSDPTKNYVTDIIKPNISQPNEKMYTAYNTYEGIGLPPGAICNPGEEAIRAVLYPAQTDYYYFCADLETKQIYYARTLNEHQQNLAKAHLN